MHFDDREHLSQINTLWTVLEQAHRGPPDEAAQARRVLMQRYWGAAYRYLLAAVRSPSVAEDLAQEFVVRFLEGRFGNADRARGSFRNYVKTALFHLVSDWRRRFHQSAVSLETEGLLIAAPDEQAAAEEAFRASWRDELLARAWRGLQTVEQTEGKPFFTVLRVRVEGPELSSEQLAQTLSERLQRPFNAANARQILHRARERFAEILLAEVRQSLEGAEEELEDELADLNLLKYCQGLIDRS